MKTEEATGRDHGGVPVTMARMQRRPLDAPPDCDVVRGPEAPAGSRLSASGAWLRAARLPDPGAPGSEPSTGYGLSNPFANTTGPFNRSMNPQAVALGSDSMPFTE